MKKLSLEKMENVEGGTVTEIGCAAAFLILTPAFFAGTAGALICIAGLIAGEA